MNRFEKHLRTGAGHALGTAGSPSPRSHAFTWTASCLGLVASAAMAQSTDTQSAPTSAPSSEPAKLQEVVVTARRKNENLQEVPMTDTVVTGKQVRDYNLFQFTDVEELAPGLSLTTSAENGGLGPVAQLRGIGYNPNSAASPAVDVYFNEMPLDPNLAFQSMYDVGQIEVLRGPQGTLRGRPAPAGAITLNTVRPDLTSFGGQVAVTATDRDAQHFEGGFNVPLIKDRWAVRIAGMYDANPVGEVNQISTGAKESDRTPSGRITSEFKPLANVDVLMTYQHLVSHSRTFAQTVGDGKGYNGPAIQADDRESVQKSPTLARQKSDIASLTVNWDFSGQRLTYIGGYQRLGNMIHSDLDPTNAVPRYSPMQSVNSDYSQLTQELRLSSAEPHRFWDYTIGAWFDNLRTKTSLSQPIIPLGATGGAFGNPSSPDPTMVPVPQYTSTFSGTEPTTNYNSAIFGNTTFHLPYSSDFSVGARYLRDATSGNFTTSTTAFNIPIGISPGKTFGGCGFLPPPPSWTGTETYPGYCDATIPASTSSLPNNRKYEAWVYSASLSHHFTDNIMGYTSYGHSWRGPGETVAVVGNAVTSDLIYGKREKSDSVELGFKSDWFRHRVRFNADVYHQYFNGYIGRFDNIPYNGGLAGVQVGSFTYNGNAVVNGAEAELIAKVTNHWRIDLSWSTADGHYLNAALPCHDTNFDGQPDNGPTPATWPKGQGPVAFCKLSSAISTLPSWSATAQSEFSYPVLDRYEGYARGLIVYQPENGNANSFAGSGFVRSSYGTVDLYVGLRGGADISWDVSLWAKNLLDNTTELTLGSPGSYAGFQSGYMQTTMNPKREVGITIRTAFGGG